MSSKEFPYREALLQWIWQELQFHTQSMCCSDGTPIQILEPGKPNSGAGPDFTEAIFRYGNLKVHGDVEIHTHPGQWNAHNHSASAAFNRVALHVVYSSGDHPGVRALRPDGTTPPLLELKPYLSNPLHDLIEAKKRAGIPCSTNTLFLNQEAFEAQIRKAHKEYFSYKTGELMRFYESHLPVPKAWARMFTAGLFNTLGMPRNRSLMTRLHSAIAGITVKCSQESFIHAVQNQAFTGRMKSEWAVTGMRPASFPKNRVTQAAALYHGIHRASLSQFLDKSLSGWVLLLKNLPETYRPGRQMLSILQQTIYYPATYLLGEFLFSVPLKQNAYNAWLQSEGVIPKEVTDPFKLCGYRINQATRKAGLAHQLKRFCRPGNCHRCEVFKKAISS